MKLANIVNDNENLKINLTNNDNDIVAKPQKSHSQVEAIAEELCRRFKSRKSYEFYCLIAYKLSESKIWLNYEKCQKGKNPGGLFNYLCRRDMKA